MRQDTENLQRGSHTPWLVVTGWDSASGIIWQLPFECSSYKMGGSGFPLFQGDSSRTSQVCITSRHTVFSWRGCILQGSGAFLQAHSPTTESLPRVRGRAGKRLFWNSDSLFCHSWDIALGTSLPWVSNPTRCATGTKLKIYQFAAIM